VKWITAQQLNSWAETLDVRSRLSELVSDLVRASVHDMSSFRFPTGDSAQIPGYDGRLICSDGSLYVPEGESVWEFGTSADYMGKAKEDYSKRTMNPGEIDPKLNTFVLKRSGSSSRRRRGTKQRGKNPKHKRSETADRRHWQKSQSVMRMSRAAVRVLRLIFLLVVAPG